MRLLKIHRIMAYLVVLVLLAGCYSAPIRFGGSNDISFDRTSVDFSKGREIVASASGFQLLLFIPINVNSRQESAYQQLRAIAGRDYITDIRIEESWTYGLIGTLYTTTIKATAYPHKTN
jgi:hypothetical protein